MYKLSTGDSKGRAHHWFATFLAYHWPIHLLSEALSKYNVNSEEFNNIGDPIIFESEEEAVLFILKWSK